MTKGKFGTAINCIDGRVQLSVIKWMKEKFHLDYVDMITEPSVDKVMSNVKDKRIELIKSKVRISVDKHRSKIIVIVGHYDCASNSVSKTEHLRQIKKTVAIIKSWHFQSVDKIIGIWINKNWTIEQIIKM